MVEDDVDLVDQEVALEAATRVPHDFAHRVLEQRHPAQRLDLAPRQRVVVARGAVVHRYVVRPVAKKTNKQYQPLYNQTRFNRLMSG